MTDERIQKVTMPKWGLSMTTGKIIEWFAEEGDTIGKGDDLVDIDTDKIAGTLESTAQGTLRRIVAPVGSELPIGATLALVAPPNVLDGDIEAAVAEALAEIESGALEADDEPATQSVEVGGRVISYLTLGEQTERVPVVLVHGYGGDKNSWLFVQQPLAESRPVHALDLPGHGASSKDVGDGSLQVFADTLLGFLDAIGIGRAHLVGHSLGGTVAAAAAKAAPDKVASLTLLAPAGLGGRPNAGYLRGFASAQSRRELKPLLGDLFAEPDLVTRQLVDDLLRYKRLDGVPAALEAILSTLLTDTDEQAIDARALLDGLDVPVMIVWGRADKILPRPERVDRMDITDLDAGHMPHMESANDLVRLLQQRL